MDTSIIVALDGAEQSMLALNMPMQSLNAFDQSPIWCMHLRALPV